MYAESIRSPDLIDKEQAPVQNVDGGLLFVDLHARKWSLSLLVDLGESQALQALSPLNQ